MKCARVTFVLAMVLVPGSARADDVLGTWLRDNGGVQVKFERCEAAICGRIVWLKPGADTKARIGQLVFSEMRPDGENTWTGKAFDPKNGSTYSGKMWIAGNALTTSGCLIGGLICKSIQWSRL